MLDMQMIFERLQLADKQITAECIADLIKENVPTATELIRKYNAYKTIGLPISSRKLVGTNKANNKFINDFRGEIIDQVVGYLFGNPANYFLNDEEADLEAHKKNFKVLKDFKKLNRIESLDAETGKMMSICGRSARLLYIDIKGRERAMHVDPWECIFIYDRSLDEVQYALRYYNVYIKDGKDTHTRIRVEWYDNKKVSYYVSNKNGAFVSDYTQQVMLEGALTAYDEQPHMFDKVPLIDFQNNTELMGDFEKVESLVNGYDRLLSDSQNEIEDLRQAYLIFKGVTPDEAVLKKAKETGAFGVGIEDEVAFLTKTINDAFIENQKKSLRENIYRFGRTVDVSADTFTGSGASGEARKWLLLALENRGATKERNFKNGIQEMFEVLNDVWHKKGLTIDATNIDVQLDRNLPVELKVESEIQSLLKGVISDKTRLGLLTVITDVEAEIKQIALEQEGIVDLDVPDEKDIDKQAVADGGMTQEEFDAKYPEVQNVD